MKSRLFVASSGAALALGLLGAGSAAAQQPAPEQEQAVGADAAGADQISDQGGSAGPSEAADIVVTGSRISVSGYAQPTPVTTVDEAVLQRDAKVSIGDTIRELPAVGTSSSPNNGQGAGNIVAGITGLDTINLRQLGTTRTLVLFDGQRVVQSNVTGQIDLGTIPTMLVERIDVVTAGASAAWGSDAVAGVVNLVLNKKFDGARISGEAGNSYKFDHQSYRFQAAFGTGFDEDRGRVIAAVNYLYSPDVVFGKDRSWNRYRQLIDNPAYTASNGEPKFIHVDNVGLSQATTGGLITGGPFRGIQFLGPNATPTPFNFGIVSGPVSSGGDAEILHPSIDNLTVDYNTLSAFGYLSYQFADWLKASVQLNYGRTKSRNNSVPAIRPGNVKVDINNPYLPDAFRQMVNDYNALNPTKQVTSFQFGTTNMNNLALTDRYSLDKFEKMLGIPVATTERTLKRGVFTLEGDLGGDWSWNAYYQRGQVRVYQTTRSNVIGSRYAQAVDAVRDPVSGQIVCRDRSNGCVPLNIFGTGVASPQAIEWVNVVKGQNYQIQRLTEDVGAVSVQGKLPFGLPAGQIAVAAGAEYRREKGEIESDAGAQARIYSVANFPTFYGKYNVKEAFLEAEIPLLKDSVVDSLSLNAAGRITDYSTSGVVKTWKLGLTSQINDDIRLRGTVSRDIRAPNLNELFSTGLSTLGSAVDPNTGQNVAIFSFASGNPNLTPEIARTYSAGVVLSPSFLSRFNLSVDYYNINLKDAISTIRSGEVLDRCVAGQTQFCPQLIFNGPNGALSQINTLPQNLANLKTDGLDIQADWTLPLGEASLQLRVMGNYIFNLSQDQLGKKVKYAGAIGPDNPVSGVPRARFTANATYSRDALSLTGQVRFIGAAKLVYDWTPKDVDDNSIPAIAYVDLRGSYEIAEGIQAFFAVDNLLNTDPPNVAASPARGQTAYYFTAVRGDIYDTLGRSYRLGMRFKF